MSDLARPTDRDDEPTPLIEIVAAILLGIAASLAAFGAYQAALTDGEALAGYTESSQLLTDANFFYQASAQQQTRDQQLFLQYAQAANTPGQEAVAEFILTSLMDPNLAAAVDWWATTDDALTPFDALDGNPYQDPAGEEADALQGASESRFAEGSAADDQGDQMELAGVILAISLFFGGVATLLRSRTVGWALLAVSGVTILAGGGLILSRI